MRLWIKILLVCLLMLMTVCVFLLGWRCGVISKLRETSRPPASMTITGQIHVQLPTVFTDGGFSFHNEQKEGVF